MKQGTNIPWPRFWEEQYTWEVNELVKARENATLESQSSRPSSSGSTRAALTPALSGEDGNARRWNISSTKGSETSVSQSSPEMDRLTAVLKSEAAALKSQQLALMQQETQVLEARLARLHQRVAAREEDVKLKAKQVCISVRLMMGDDLALLLDCTTLIIPPHLAHFRLFLLTG